MSTYQRSTQHIQNFQNFLAVGRERYKQLNLIKIEKYNSNPKLCLHCDDPIEYKKKNNKFCSKSCSTTFTNLLRPPKSLEVKKKISLSLKGRPTNLNNSKYKIERNEIKYYENPLFCKICGKIKSYNKRHHKTCSRECNIISSTQRTYQNGSKKYFYYKGIALESSWELEVAQLLDSLNIKWIRPKPMQYIDQENKSRMYYPDFYLSDHNIYLDPKNEYCMQKDVYKMQQIEKQVSITYGNIKKIKEFINLLGVG